MTAMGIALCVGATAAGFIGAHDAAIDLLTTAAIVFALGYVGDQIRRLEPK